MPGLMASGSIDNNLDAAIIQVFGVRLRLGIR